MYYIILAAFITIPLAFRISRYVIENKQKYLNILDAITVKLTLFFAFSSFIAYVIIYYINGLPVLKL